MFFSISNETCPSTNYSISISIENQFHPALILYHPELLFHMLTITERLPKERAEV